MPTSPGGTLEWIVLTRGDRAHELAHAVASVHPEPVTLVVNGAAQPPTDAPPADRVVALPENVGVPAGRDVGLRSVDAELVGFLDDDAEARPGVNDAVREAFAADPQLGAVALRLVDETGATARRHVPRLGGQGADRSGEVALFLGGACAVRREAYLDAGGYWGDLFYGHEEVELCWRLVDRGWRIGYLADAVVFHPRTEISRHADGWRLTGRNRVLIARRTLPWPVAIVHVAAWLVLGAYRALDAETRRAYVAGWREGWRHAVDRSPIRWRTVARLALLGRPPIL